MVKKHWTTSVALCLIGITVLSLFLSEIHTIFGVGVLGGGIAAFIAGANIVAISTIGRPIPFELLRSQEFILIERIDSSSRGLALVALLGGAASARFVEGVPADIKEGDTFIPREDGLVSIVARHVIKRETVG